MILRIFVLVLLLSFLAAAQSGGGQIEGTVADPTGALIPGATVTISNSVTGYKRSTTTDQNGAFAFRNVPQNPYHVEASANGFTNFDQDAVVRSAVPVSVKITLQLAGSKTEVNVEASGNDLIETVPSAHTDVDRELYSKLPLSSNGNGLADAITLASPGVAADSNGMFHPLGDHSQSALYLDGQPITDQQSKAFSTSIPLNAIQSMELVTSNPNAEYGDKTSLVANAVTRSGLGAAQPFGSLETHYGSFGSYGEDFSFGIGGTKWGEFLVADSSRSGRFLDSPEYTPLHDIGNSETIFNRFDWQPTGKDSVHLNLFLARNWFQIPNTYDQQATDQDQRQLSQTYSIAPGWVHTFSSTSVMTLNPFIRSDFINYYPSGDIFNDQPATVAEKRSLKNYGMRGDISWVKHGHNVKTGIQISRTHLNENFNFGITDPTYVDPATQPGLLPYDLTRGGHLFTFSGAANIDQFAWYVQDAWTFGNWTINGGIRFDWYDGLTRDTGWSPRAGIAYHIKPTGTVLRIGYAHSFETPYNENLILSSALGSGGLAENAFGAYGNAPLRPGRRDSYNAGLEQSIGKHVLIAADYFWKYTQNGFDFSALLDTPIVFPITWRKSKLDGVGARINLTNIHGFSAFTSLGHSRARYFGPSNGGLIFDSPLGTSVFRIDHDQAFQQTTHLRYEARSKLKPWIAFTWRYDSGMVAGAVTDLSDALALDGDQQAAIGFYCGSQRATISNPITSCSSPNYGATRINIPAPGTYDPDHNPPRITPRNLFDVGIGIDNLTRTESRYKVKLELQATNLTNQAALYNFLSTFSGTHWVTPRSYEATIGFSF